MKEIKETRLLSKMQALAQSYVPEWKFSREDPDPGSVVAILCCDMLEESRKRFDQVLHKHKIQYMNLFDRLKEEPVESARTYVKFSPVAGVDRPVPVPKGTQLYTENEDIGKRIVFETLHSLTVTPAELHSIYATDRRTDCIVELMSGEGHAEEARFHAFDLSAENSSEHIFLLGWDQAFDELKSLDLNLRLHSASEVSERKALEALCSGQVELRLLTREGEEGFDLVENRQGVLHLVKNEYTPEKVELDGKPRYVLAFRARELCEAEINGMELSFAANDLEADEVYCKGLSQNTEHFLPFGSPMEIYAECGFECKELFARRGAAAEMSFNLSYEALEQALPEYETQMNYKVIMRQPKSMPRPVRMDVKADYVVIEYYAVNGWKRLIKEENVALLFNGSGEGRIDLRFTVPEDLIEAENYPFEYRMRLRLLRADNLYQLPIIQYCPVIDHLRFAYNYTDAAMKPEKAVTRNNFDTVDVTKALEERQTVSLFYNKELEQTAMYLGFDKPIWGTPVSLYFEIENNEDRPIDFSMEYHGPGGFDRIKLIDNTCGMLYSGAMLMIIPSDIQKTTLFGKELYWLRMICHSDTMPDAELPLIKGIFTNMAQAENRRTQEEIFYVDPNQPSVEVQLAENEIIHAQVFVNEASDDPNAEGENWVRWKKGSFYSGEGRIYEIDMNAGKIRFERNVFANYPINPTGPSIKVEYQSYQGADANVGVGAINTLSESIRYITRAVNPIAAYGGYDCYNEKTAASMISNMLRTRNRAISEQDYFDMISQVSYGVRRIKCRNGIDQYGQTQDDAITIAVLINEYKQGSHIFSAVKDQIRKKLLESSSILPLGKTLILSQPYFVRFDIRLWLECANVDNAYDLQKETEDLISQFIDPLTGNFDGNGWEIGILPTMQEILAFLKIRQPQVTVTRTVITANFGHNEHAVNDNIYKYIKNPFAMAVNGTHTVYVDLK